MTGRTGRRLSVRRAHGFGLALRASYEALGQSLAALNNLVGVLAFRQHKNFSQALARKRNE